MLCASRPKRGLYYNNGVERCRRAVRITYSSCRVRFSQQIAPIVSCKTVNAKKVWGHVRSGDIALERELRLLLLPGGRTPAGKPRSPVPHTLSHIFSYVNRKSHQISAEIAMVCVSTAVSRLMKPSGSSLPSGPKIIGAAGGLGLYQVVSRVCTL